MQAGYFLINSYFSMFYVLFLMRVRKRTKKKRALRQGAGFSVNRLRGTNATRWPATSVTRAKTSARNGSTRKNPPYPRSLERKNLLLRETWPCSLFPLGERAGERGLGGGVAFDFAFGF